MSRLDSARMEMPIRDKCSYKYIKRSWLNYALMGVLVAVFAYQVGFLKDDAIYYMLNWNLVVGGEWWRLITHIFLHADWWVWFMPVHLVSNLYFLWLFGDNVEDWFGRNKYLRFGYFGVFVFWGVVAGIVFGVSQPETYCLGASGAISGALGFYFIMYPYAQIDVLSMKAIPVNKWDDLVEVWNSKIIYPVSAYYFLWGWFSLQVLLWWQGSAESVAYLAHVGGFIVGVVTALVCKVVTKEEVSSEFIQKLLQSIKELISKLWGDK